MKRNLKWIITIVVIMLTSSIIYANNSNRDEVILLSGVNLNGEDDEILPSVSSDPSLFGRLFSDAYRSMEQTVSGVCPNTSNTLCTTFEVELSAAGYLSAKVTMYFYRGI